MDTNVKRKIHKDVTTLSSLSSVRVLLRRPSSSSNRHSTIAQVRVASNPHNPGGTEYIT